MKKLKKALSLLLSLFMIMSCISGTAYATEGTDDSSSVISEATDENATESTAEGNYEDFYKMVLIDCGRGYYTVNQIKTIIDKMSACDYEYLMLGFGNDGLRFLLDDMSVTVNETTYSSDAIKKAIISKNDELAPNAKGQWSQSDIDSIISYASSKGISIVPLLNTPGHATSITAAMTACGIPAALDNRNGSTDNGSTTFDVTNTSAVNFATALIQKYIDYFAGKGCTNFNLGMDEFAGNNGGWTEMSDTERSALESYLATLSANLVNSGMNPIAFCDVIGNSSNVPSAIIGINWNGKSLNDHRNINANYNWYYVLGATGDVWAGYDRALSYTASASVNTTIGGSADAGCLLAIWNDNYLAADDYVENINNLIYSQASNNPSYFTISQEEEITVEVGHTYDISCDSDTVIDKTNLDTNIATASDVVTTGGETVATYTKVSSLEEGKQYIILSAADNSVLGTGSATYNKTTGLALTKNIVTVSGNNLTGSNLDQYLWTYVSDTNSGNSIKSVDGQYPAFDYENVSMTSKSSTALARVVANSTVSGAFNIKDKGSYYLNNYGKNGTCAAGWQSESTETNNLWYFYEYTPVSQYKVTVTGVSVGDTTMKIGDTLYTIHIVAEDLSEVSLSYDPWIGDYAVYPSGTGAENCSDTEAVANSQTLIASTSGVNTEEGVDFSTVAWETGDWRWEGDSVETTYWKGVVLSAENTQVGHADSCRAMDGTDFRYIRYWNGKWSVSSDRVTWTDVQSTDEVCAYYLQKTDVTEEVTTYVKDWAFTTDDASSHTSKYQKALAFAVVYPDGQMSPSADDIYADSTLIYWYDTTNMFIRFGVNDIYEIEKITYTPGERVNQTNDSFKADDSINWDMKEIDGNEWYNETTCWDETYGTEPVVDCSEIDAFNNTNYTTNDGMLILIYLKPVIREDSLTVQYWDDSGMAEIYRYNVNILSKSTDTEEGTFVNRLKNNADTAVAGQELILDDEAYVVNAANVYETFQKDLSKIPSLMGKYTSGLYEYVKAEISADGKTLILHYKLNPDKLSKSYLVDFGLPLEISITDLTTASISEVTAQNGIYGNASVTGTSMVTYTPSKVIQGRDTIRVTVTFSDNTTQDFTVAIYPATTVYYEESFASGDFTGGSNGTTAQQTQDTNNTGYNVFGYDSAYDSNYAASSGSAAQSSTTATGNSMEFTFTGTGVDIYTNCTDKTGIMLVQIKNSAGSTVKMAVVDTIKASGDTKQTKYDPATLYSMIAYSVTDLDYGTYTVVLGHTQTKAAPLTVRTDGINLDGFRVYNTMSTTANEIYKTVNEENPTFIEVRDLALQGVNLSQNSEDYASYIGEQVYKALNTSDENVKAIVLDNSKTTEDAVEITTDLIDNGPKNELFLYPGQTLALTLNTQKTVQVGLRSVTGTASCTVNGTATNVSTTDMFYTAKVKGDGDNKTLIISNSNESNTIISVTKIKVSDEVTINTITEESIVDALHEMGYQDEDTYADAILNLSVTAGDEVLTTTLTANGVQGESATFTAVEIERAVAGLDLPEGYELTDVVYKDVEVEYGATAEQSFVASEIVPATADATLTIVVKTEQGKEIGRTTLTYTGEEGESHTFTKSEIKAAANKIASDKGYKISSSGRYKNIKVNCGHSSSVSFTASKTQKGGSRKH